MITVIKNAHILSLDATDQEIIGGDIVVKGNQIASVGVGAGAEYMERADKVVDATGLMAMPGLVNGHYHSTSAFMKGAFENLPLEVYMLHDFPIGGLAHEPRVYYLRSALGAIELLKQGVTAVRDDVHYFGVATDQVVAPIMEAYRDCGIRSSVGFGIANLPECDKLPFLETRFSDEQRDAMMAEQQMSADDIESFYERAFTNWHGSSDGRLSIHTSCSGPQRVTASTMEVLSQLSAKYDVSFDMHIQETKTQRVHGDVQYGKSILQYVDDLGVLNEHTVVIHGVWLDDADLDRVADRNAVIAHNPVSNLKLGSGVMPFSDVVGRGIPVCLGTDEAAADDGTNLWANAKIGALLQKIGAVDYHDWPLCEEYLNTMCHGGARAMRRSEHGGCIEAGRDADIILLDLNSVAFTPLNNLKRQLVFAENGGSVVLTMVAGNIVCERGKMLTVDEDAIKQEIRDITPQYQEACRVSNEENEYLVQLYREVYLQAANTDVGFSRWLSSAS